MTRRPVGSLPETLHWSRTTGLAPVRAEGPDATAFLDAQLTLDLDAVRRDRAALAALADPRGRVLAVPRLWHSAGGWRLVVPRGEEAWLCGYLSRFVFRARVRLAPEEQIATLGLAGRGAPTVLERLGLPVPDPGGVAADADLEVIDLGGECRLLCGREQRLSNLAEGMAARLPEAGAEEWHRLRIAGGEPLVGAAVRGRYLPQMLALDEAGAVDFGKGCFPGQEVIARTRNLGRIKRRIALVELPFAPPPAGERFEIAGHGLEVLAAAAAPGGGYWAQVIAAWPLPAAIGRLVPAGYPAQT